MRPTPERTLEYGTNSREDFYKVLYSILVDHAPFASVPGFSALDMGQKRGIKAAFDNFAEIVVHLAHMSSVGDGQINPVHRPVVEQLMTDLQAMLNKMPVEEKPEQPNAWELAEESAREAGARTALELKSAALVKKTWICPDHGIRPWQSKPGLLRAWCHKGLADGTECGHELVERDAGPVKTIVEAAFDSVQQATVQTKKLCREENISVARVNSSYLPSGKAMQTIITMPDDTSDATYAKLVAVLNEAGYTSIRVHSDVDFVSACSRLQGMFANA